MSERQIGLALGGGGGKGSAHIGILQVLERLEVPIDALAGTSIGGIVAALYAVGYGPDDIAGWFARGASRRLWAPDRTNRGLIGTTRIAALMREAFGDRTFADTRIPLALVAVDIQTGREVILREGPLVDAVLATSAIPGIFPPVVRDREVLVDGGVLNNVPVSIARALGADRVIAVDLGMVTDEWTWPLPTQVTTRPWSLRRLVPRTQVLIAERALVMLTARATSYTLAENPPAVLLRPAVGSLHTLDFGNVAEGRMYGEQAALEQQAALEDLRVWRAAQPESGAASDTGRGRR